MDTASILIDYARMGYRLLPLRPGEKRPLIRDWPDRASNDLAVIREWARRWPNCNWGIVTGEGLSVLDIDPAALEAGWPGDQRRAELRGTGCPLAKTPRGGYHLFFRAAWPSSAGKIASSVDTRGRRAFIAVAPSKTADGRYGWIRPLRPVGRLPEPPEWLDDLVKAAARPALHPTDHPFTTPKTLADRALEDCELLREGTRNVGLTRLAGRLRRLGLSQSEVEAALLAANRIRCLPPLPEKEVRAIAASISRYPPGPAFLGQAGGRPVTSTIRRAWRHAIRSKVKKLKHRRPNYGKGL